MRCSVSASGIRCRLRATLSDLIRDGVVVIGTLSVYIDT